MKLKNKCEKSLIKKNFFLFNHNYNNPKISIIIPILNKNKFIPIILCSIQNQSIKEIEIIFIDDYSIDNSIKIIQFYMKKDKRINLIKNNKNYGVFYSRFYASKISKGEYINFVDPDDYLFKDILNFAYNQAKKTMLKYYNIDT